MLVGARNPTWESSGRAASTLNHWANSQARCWKTFRKLSGDMTCSFGGLLLFCNFLKSYLEKRHTFHVLCVEVRCNRGQLVVVGFPLSLVLTLGSNLGCQSWQQYLPILHCLSLWLLPILFPYKSLNDALKLCSSLFSVWLSCSHTYPRSLDVTVANAFRKSAVERKGLLGAMD